MTNQSSPEIPSCAWSRPIGKGWDKPYTVRYPSNIDDGPWHGMPLGGFGAGCIGRSSRGDFNLWHIDGGNILSKLSPLVNLVYLSQMEVLLKHTLCVRDRLRMIVWLRGSGIRKGTR